MNVFIWKKREMGAYMEERNGCINGVLKDECPLTKHKELVV